MVMLCASGEVVQPVQPCQSWAAEAAPDTWHRTTAEPVLCFQMKLISEQVRSRHRNDLSCSALRAKSHLYPLILNCNPLWDSLNCSAFKSGGSGTDTECWVRTAQSVSGWFCCLSEKGDVTKKGGSWKRQEIFSKKALWTGLLPSIWFFPWHTKGLMIPVTAWEAGLVIPTLLCRVSEHIRLWARAGSRLSKHPVNDNRTWSLLRGQVPRPK